MSVWFSSDLHVGHASVARMRMMEEYPQFAGMLDESLTEIHDQTLACNWDKVIQPDDTVWVLGDISSGTKTGQLNALEWIKQRPGVKHLISGNHDGTHSMHRDSMKWKPLYLDGAFATVDLAGRRRLSTNLGHVDALLSHFPFRGDHTTTERYPQWRLPDLGKDFIIHGHTHSSKRMRGRQIHVGVDAWDLCPVHLDELVAMVFKEAAA